MVVSINQIEQIEKFIAEIEDLKKRKQNSKSFYEEAKNLDKRVEAIGLGYKSSINWNKPLTRSSYNSYTYSDTAIVMNLVYVALQGILNAQPYYDRLLEIRQTIYDIVNVSFGTKRDIIMHVIEEYGDAIGWDMDEPPDDIASVEYEVVFKLNKYIRRLHDEFDREKLEKQQSSAINVVQTNSQISNRTVSFSI